MAIIQESTENFKKLAETTSYIFHTSLNRKITVFSLNFKEMDFRHAIGLHYLTDIDITRNAKKTIQWIQNNAITDEYLARSVYYAKR